MSSFGGISYCLIKSQIKLKAGLALCRFSQKMNKRIRFVCCEKQKSKQNKFVCFLGEFTARKSAFGFIWPLVSVSQLCNEPSQLLLLLITCTTFWFLYFFCRRYKRNSRQKKTLKVPKPWISIYRYEINFAKFFHPTVWTYALTVDSKVWNTKLLAF